MPLCSLETTFDEISHGAYGISREDYVVCIESIESLVVIRHREMMTVQMLLAAFVGESD